MSVPSWTSLDLDPPGLSSVATVPSVPWYSLSSVGTSPPFDWISLSAAGNGLPLDGQAYNAAEAQRVTASSAALDGALAWLVGRTRLLHAAWSEPGAPLVDPEARRLAFARVWASFAIDALTSAGISGLTLGYLLRDFGVEDGDLVSIRLTQFGRILYEGRLSLLNAGTAFSQQLRHGVAQLTIIALNEGSLPPNTAEVRIADVVRGEGTQSYSLNTGENATLRIEANVAGRR